MNRKQKKELRRHLSTRQLMGVDQLTEHGLKTAKGELVFFLLSPDNLSVLSSDGVRNRVRALTELLRQGKARKERLPFLRSIAARIGGSESFLRAYLALAVFQERGLVSLTREGDWLAMYLMGDPENVTWDDCPYLLRLREKEAT